MTRINVTIISLLLCGIKTWYLVAFPPPMVRQPLVGQGLFIIEASRSYSDTPHSVGLLGIRDPSVAETSTWRHITLTRERHPCPWRDSNPQSQQASWRRPTA